MGTPALPRFHSVCIASCKFVLADVGQASFGPELVGELVGHVAVAPAGVAVGALGRGQDAVDGSPDRGLGLRHDAPC